MSGVLLFLGLSSAGLNVSAPRNSPDGYLDMWSALANSTNLVNGQDAREIARKFGDRAEKLGYPLHIGAASALPSGAPRTAPGAPTFPLARGPDFLILGAQKAGTSSLFNYLCEHPAVEQPFKKELHFFDRPAVYRRGIDWYQAFFPKTSNAGGGIKSITGEGTPYYLYHPRVPALVARHFPKAKLIAILRNPADRAYSHYQMVVRRGTQEKLSFEDAIDAESERLDGVTERMLADDNYESAAHIHFSYLARGRYAEQLMRWAEYFPREQMLVLESDCLRNEQAATLAKVYEFLGIGPWEVSTQPFTTRVRIRRWRQERENAS